MSTTRLRTSSFPSLIFATTVRHYFTYCHSHIPGKPRDFTVKTLNVVPEILVRVGDAELKKKFINLPKKAKRQHDLPEDE